MNNNEGLNSKHRKDNKIKAVNSQNPFFTIIQQYNHKKQYKAKTSQQKFTYISRIELPNGNNQQDDHKEKEKDNRKHRHNQHEDVIKEDNDHNQQLSSSELLIHSLRKEIERLHLIINEKDNQLTIAKEQINRLMIENLATKSKLMLYKEKFDSIVNDQNIISKETILGLYDEGIVPSNNENQPNIDQMTYEDLLELEEKIGYVSKGFTREQIDKIPKQTYRQSSNTDNDNNQCIICQSTIVKGEQIKTLSCNHIYHDTCIDIWLEKEKCCPFCKTEAQIP